MKSPEDGTLMGVFTAYLNDTLFTLTSEQEESVVGALMNWLNNEARLKPVPDLADRLVSMAPRVRKMAENLTVSIDEGKLVVKTDAESEATLNLFRRGSSWFDPHPDVEAAILRALVEGSTQ